jgi:peptide subunit release factor 1 (eRF1)
MQKILYEVGHDTGMITYGEGEVRMVLMSEELDLVRVTIKCGACGFEEQHTVKG